MAGRHCREATTYVQIEKPFFHLQHRKRQQRRQRRKRKRCSLRNCLPGTIPSINIDIQYFLIKLKTKTQLSEKNWFTSKKGKDNICAMTKPLDNFEILGLVDKEVGLEKG
jgi:hypothetical protein